jgi:hypothetical protein
MKLFLILLCAFGLCFWIQNKLTFLKDKFALLDSMISCSYCLGFHCGWISYSLVTLSNGESLLWYMFVIQAIVHGFACAVFCYFFDELSLLIESKK